MAHLSQDFIVDIATKYVEIKPAPTFRAIPLLRIFPEARYNSTVRKSVDIANILYLKLRDHICCMLAGSGKSIIRIGR